MEEVVLKLQRPIATNGSKQEIMSYIVDEGGDRASNPFMQQMKKKDIKKLFGDHYKVYYLCEFVVGQPVLIKEPIWEDEWV